MKKLKPTAQKNEIVDKVNEIVEYINKKERFGIAEPIVVAGNLTEEEKELIKNGEVIIAPSSWNTDTIDIHGIPHKKGANGQNP